MITRLPGKLHRCSFDIPARLHVGWEAGKIAMEFCSDVSLKTGLDLLLEAGKNVPGRILV